MNARHRPQRSCVACRETMDQRELIRLVRGADGLVIDEGRRAPGRGAYLCRRPACWARAGELSSMRGGGPLGHALRAAIDDRDRAVLASFERTLRAPVASAAGRVSDDDAGGGAAHRQHDLEREEHEGESGTA